MKIDEITLNADVVMTICVLLENPSMVTNKVPPTNKVAKSCIEILHNAIKEWCKRVDESKKKEEA